MYDVSRQPLREKYAFVPLAVGLMIGPTATWRIAVSELPRTSIVLRGLPLPWCGDAPIGSGPPLDLYIVPACIDLAAYLLICTLIRPRLRRSFESAGRGIRVSLVAIIWSYSVIMLALLGVSFIFGGTAMLWYESDYWDALIGVGLGFAF